MSVGAPLRVLPQTPGVDLGAAERAAAAFLAALGVTGPGRDPRRMARAYAELLNPRSFDLTTFPNDEGSPGSWSCTPTVRRCRSGSPPRSPTGCTATCTRAEFLALTTGGRHG